MVVVMRVLLAFQERSVAAAAAAAVAVAVAVEKLLHQQGTQQEGPHSALQGVFWIVLLQGF